MSEIITQLIRIGADQDTVNYLIKSLKDAGDNIDCQFTQYLLSLKGETDINIIVRQEISKYLISKAFKNIETEFLSLIQNENIEESTKQFIKVIASSILLVPGISNSNNHFIGLATQVLDVVAYHVNNTQRKSIIIGGEIEKRYNIILSLISKVNIFICQLPCLDINFKNNYKTYLDCALLILKHYPTGIYSLHQVISQVFMALQQGIDICVSCKTCEKRETCKDKDKNNKLN